MAKSKNPKGYVPVDVNDKNTREFRSNAPPSKGWHNLIIAGAKWKRTKDKKGSYLNVRYEVYSGVEKGAAVYDMLNLVNKSSEAVEIAKARTKRIQECVGIEKLTNPEKQLKGKKLRGKVSHETYNDRDTGRIDDYEPLTDEDEDEEEDEESDEETESEDEESDDDDYEFEEDDDDDDD